jgi:hypothetical protein
MEVWFDTGSYYEAQAGLKITILLTLYLPSPGLQLCRSTSGDFVGFEKFWLGNFKERS